LGQPDGGEQRCANRVEVQWPPLVTLGVGQDMKKTRLFILFALLVLSIWIGFQIDPDRDWTAWLFIVGLPVSIALSETISQMRAFKKRGNDEH
jgi:hypothetical protein